MKLSRVCSFLAVVIMCAATFLISTPAHAVSVVADVLNCDTERTLPPIPAGNAWFMSLANPNASGSVRYAIFDQRTSNVVDSGVLYKGDVTSKIIPAGNAPLIIRLQNNSGCDSNNITPRLDYAGIEQEG